MKDTVFNIGDIVEIEKGAVNYKIKDIFKITDLRGIVPGSKASPNNTYYASRYSRKDKTWAITRESLYHRDLKYLDDRRIKAKIIEIELKELEQRKINLLKEKDYLEKYESDNDYKAHLIQELAGTSGDIEKIRGIIKSVPNHFL